MFHEIVLLWISGFAVAGVTLCTILGCRAMLLDQKRPEDGA